MREIIWKGNEHTNRESRYGVVPILIVNHISTSTMYSMDQWFTDPNNKQSSAHFGVGKGGEIHQYVAIEDNAWANGLPVAQIPLSPAPIVRDMACNPNYYSVSIEHEGTDGELTEEQFKSSCWLHRYIMQYILDKWGVNMGLGGYNVLGHYQIDPWRRPNCPGPKFPWERMRAELAVAEAMTLQEYEYRLWPPEQTWEQKIESIKPLYSQINYMTDLIKAGPSDGNAHWALNNLLDVVAVMKDKKLL